MALNFEAAQLVVGAAILDPHFARTLLRDRGRAVRAAAALPIAPAGVHFSEEDRLLLAGVRADTVQEFARCVTRMCGGLRPISAPPAAASAQEDVAAAFALAAVR